jgi:hypothetical protein
MFELVFPRNHFHGCVNLAFLNKEFIDLKCFVWKDVAFMEGGGVNVGVEFESCFYDWIGFCLC